MPHNYSFLIRVSLLLAFANSILTGILTWLVWRHAAEVPLWGQKSINSHLFLTSFTMSFVLSALASYLTQRALRKRKIMSLHWHLKNQTILDRLPAGIFPRSFILGLMGSCYASLLVYLLNLYSVMQLQVSEFFRLNFVFSVWLAAGVCVLSIYRALGSPYRK
ncbi:hypothetical protein [Pontibacter beigongshangensis]|uniref:hypothetical protein n=1 Tax=Pontibacter beigongshangensis TaxID=2574733 RepID=UPI00164F198E|nr:hypothetical protein [Pontibacter beigongshangensis]